MIFAGLAFGIAELVRFSSLILIPYFVVLIGVFFLNDVYRNKADVAFKGTVKLFWKYARFLIMIFVIGYALVYVVYSVAIWNYPAEKQRSDTQQLLGTFKNCGTSTSLKCMVARSLTGANVWAADKTILRPYAEYSLGAIMTIRRAAGGGPSYLLGEITDTGKWYYFPLTYAMKEPVPVLILLALASVVSVWQIVVRRKKYGLSTYLADHKEEFGMLVFICIYMAASMKSPLNIGLRYIIPVIPFFYILLVCRFRNWKTSSSTHVRLKLAIVVVFLGWFGVDVARAYPYYLSYFNETIGTEHGWQYVTDSNYDWGQDVKRLADFVEENNIKDRIGLHIRRGDLLEHTDSYNLSRKIEIDQFIEIYNNTTDKVFVCSEDVDIHKLFPNYSDRIVRHNPSSSDRGKEGTIEGFKDLLILSYCKKIYGGISAFSLAASSYRNVELITLYAKN